MVKNTATTKELLTLGVQAYKEGKTETAEFYFKSILETKPKNSEANHNLGVLAIDSGRKRESLIFFEAALEGNPKITHYWLSYIKALIQEKRIDDALSVFRRAIKIFPGNHEFNKLGLKLKKYLKQSDQAFIDADQPPPDRKQFLVDLYEKGHFQKVLIEADRLLISFPNSVFLLNSIGVVNAELGNFDNAILYYNKAILLDPSFTDAYNNKGIALKAQGKFSTAVEAFEKAILLSPKTAKLYNNIGNALQDLGRFKDAEAAIQKAISLEPRFTEAYHNMGNILQNLGRLKEAIGNFQKAIALNPTMAETYNNLGNAFADQGKLGEAVENFQKAISLSPKFSEAHRHLSNIKKYDFDDPHLLQMQKLFERKDLLTDARCQLSFALAKAYEDLEKYCTALDYLHQGNTIRKKLLNYSIRKDQLLFAKLKKAEANLAKNSLKIKNTRSGVTPIFIIGMPRSGTTLVEQIVSSHSKVYGAGELNYVHIHGFDLSIGDKSPNEINITNFRENYLKNLGELSNNNIFSTDKMPQNFRYLPLICAALPEAKIIHVKRDKIATCWSNYRNYFSVNGLGYSYNLKDILKYYQLYDDLEKSWQPIYKERVYYLDYEKLIRDQLKQTKYLIEYLGLEWEQSCLDPQRNTRSVQTASQQQVRKEVYQGSSKRWRKYEPYLGGIFKT